MRDLFLFISVFLASTVEAVEALTIVLAVGTTRGWRSTWYGVAAATAALAAFVIVLGPALTVIPINALRLVVGGLLLTFGLQWLRKAILRASGYIPLHDEATIFTKATSAASRVTHSGHKGIIDDWYSFTIAFKGVLLEGLEIAFIVVTFGANQGSIPLAVTGAVVAILVVVAAGLAIHKPLANVPENTLKFVVGIMLTSFGIFWGTEGAGVHWPGSDAALLGVVALMTISAIAQVAWLSRRHARLEARAA
ncbi:MAG TPA: hypothetical protein VGH44_03390 [Candidatus Saccharimonadia bacterium]|jgi:uncharacterized membrane protein